MKILHILTMHQAAGLENRAFRFIQTARNHEHLLLVISRPIHGKFKKSFSEDIKIKHWKYMGPFKIPGFLRSFFLKRWLKKNRFDLFISYSQLSYPPLWKTIFKIPDAYGIYWEGGASWFKPESSSRLLKRFRSYIAISEASALMLEKKFNIKRERIKVIHNGIPREKVEEIKEASPEGNGKKRFIILYLGRLVPVKGVDSLIKAVKKLDNECLLWIVGDGKERDRLEKITREEGVGSRVLFMGARVDPSPFLKGAHLMAVPSVREPLGNVLLEAGAAKLAVIASGIDGIPDIIRSQVNGILIKPTLKIKNSRKKKDFPEYVVDIKKKNFAPPRMIDPEKLAAEIRKLKNNPELRKGLGENLYKTVSENFIMEDKIKEFEEHIGQTYE